MPEARFVVPDPTRRRGVLPVAPHLRPAAPSRAEQLSADWCLGFENRAAFGAGNQTGFEEYRLGLHKAVLVPVAGEA